MPERRRARRLSSPAHRATHGRAAYGSTVSPANSKASPRSRTMLAGSAVTGASPMAPRLLRRRGRLPTVGCRTTCPPVCPSVRKGVKDYSCQYGWKATGHTECAKLIRTALPPPMPLLGFGLHRTSGGRGGPSAVRGVRSAGVMPPPEQPVPRLHHDAPGTQEYFAMNDILLPSPAPGRRGAGSAWPQRNARAATRLRNLPPLAEWQAVTDTPSGFAAANSRPWTPGTPTGQVPPPSPAPLLHPCSRRR